jgi:hydroxyacylglutathione hydrolase
MLTRIREDLWETRVDSPFPGLTTHAYLWTPPSGRNVLFYSTLGDGDWDEIADLGGIADQYLSHQDEAGPSLARIAARFGSRLHAPAADEAHIRRFAEPDTWFDTRHTDAGGVEVIPTPGHTPGSTSFVVPGAGGRRYLFTGDTVYPTAEGGWAAGNLPFSDPDRLAESLGLIAGLEPDLVVSSAFGGDTAAHPMRRGEWPDRVREAIAGIHPPARSGR